MSQTPETPQEAIDPSLLAQNVYLTPRCADAAIGMGFIAIRPNIEVIREVRDFVNERMTSTDYQIPEDVEEHTFLMRWAGKEGKYLWQWDTIFEKVRKNKPNTPYLNSRLITQPRIDALNLGDHLDDEVLAGKLDVSRTQELHIADWDNPDFAQKMVSGLLFKWHGRSDLSFMQRLQRDVNDAFDAESNRRFAVAKQGGQELHEPFDATSPFVRVFRNKDDLVGEKPTLPKHT
jgi:hypothetical protein